MNNINIYIQEKLIINKNIKTAEHLFSFEEFKEELMNTLKINKNECNTIITNFDTDIDIKKMPNYKYKLLDDNCDKRLFNFIDELKKHSLTCHAVSDDFSLIWVNTENPEIYVYFYDDWRGLTDGEWYIYIIDKSHKNDYIYQIIRK